MKKSFSLRKPKLVTEIKQLRQTITHKDEMINQKDTLLEAQQREISLLRSQLSL